MTSFPTAFRLDRTPRKRDPRLLCDHHVHTECSPDSQETMENYVRRAVELGLDSVCFTEHLDLDEVNLNRGYYDAGRFMANLAAARETAPLGLELRAGIEVSYSTTCEDAVRAYLAPLEFDFIIGSLHSMDDTLVWRERRGEPPPDEAEMTGLIATYLTEMEHCVRARMFHTLGHLDVPRRYSETARQVFTYERCHEQIDTVLRLAIERGVAIELNTSAGTRYNLGLTHPGPDILTAYRRLGGELITLGGDAHKAEYLYKLCDQALDMAEDLGFRYLASYVQGKAVMVPLAP